MKKMMMMHIITNDNSEYLVPHENVKDVKERELDTIGFIHHKNVDEDGFVERTVEQVDVLGTYIVYLSANYISDKKGNFVPKGGDGVYGRYNYAYSVIILDWKEDVMYKDCGIKTTVELEYYSNVEKEDALWHLERQLNFTDILRKHMI